MERKLIALIMIALIVSIPITFGAATIPDPDKACDSKKAKAKSLVAGMDNGIIKTLETVSSLMYMLCTVTSAIDMVLNILATIIGLIQPNDVPCCTNTPQTCGALGPVYTAWKNVYKFVEPYCCLVTCGWCTGQGCAEVLGANMPLFGQGYGDFGIGELHLSPFENIYTASYCLCPTAILFNLRKLKTIYQVYNCCVEQACENGISTEVCDKQLDVATCMYFEGSLLKTVVKIVMSLLIRIIPEKILGIQLGRIIPKCILRWKDLVAVPTVISNVMTSWSWFSTTFNEPECKDLGFDKLKEKIKEAPGWVPGRLADTDKDGMKDVIGPVWLTPKEAEKSYYTGTPKETNKDFGKNEIVVKENIGSSGGKVPAEASSQSIPPEDPNKKKAEDLTWMLMDMTLGSFAYGQIDKMCEKKWEASEPEK